MKVVVWGNEDCAECARVFGVLGAMGCAPEEKSVDEDLPRADVATRREVMALIQLAGGALPVVQIDAGFYAPAEAIEIAKSGGHGR